MTVERNSRGWNFPTASTAKGAFQFVAYPNCGDSRNVGRFER
jgi:hypothetical protein